MEDEQMSKKFIPLSVPNLKGNEIKYVTHAIETEWVSTAGPQVNEFEKRIAEYVKVKGAVSCQNGTSGIHTALIICGVKKGDEVIVPTLTFIATVNPVKYIGAEPVFFDCDEFLCINTKKILKFCEEECSFQNGKLINNKTKKHIKAIIAVHIFGNMADMEMLMDIANRFNLNIIEDATEALGTFYTEGKYKGSYAGTIGDVGVYSFNGNKIITTGSGGAIVSNNLKLLEKAKHLTTQAKVDNLYFTHDEIGYNYRMSNMQAALGLAQLEQLEQFIEIKKDNYFLYKEKINKIKGLSILDFRENIRPNYWFYSLYCSKDYNLNRDKIINYLLTKNIQSRPIWGLINKQKPYMKCQSYMVEKSLKYVRYILNIPCSSNLITNDVLYIIDCLKYAIF
jgi:aminotransferase in exopolysaccharide biosynthesis